MRFLVINSDALYERNDEFYIHKSTGEFIHNIEKLGLDISLFHFKKQLSPYTVSDYKLDSNKITLCGVKRGNSKILSHLRAFFALIDIIKGVDFLYLFYPSAFFYTVFFAKTFKKPYGIYLRGEKNIKSNLSKWIYRNASFVTTISPVFSKLVTESGGKSFTIKPMIDFDLEDVVIKKEKRMKRFFNLLYIGRVEKDKGIFELIDAIQILRRQNIDNFKLHIIGNGEHFDQIKESIIEKDISDLVVMHGVITDKSEIKTFYNEADIFILPTHHEGFPRVLYEAMIFNTAILTTFVGTIPYLMKDMVNCMRIEVNNPSNIVEKLIILINNPEKLQMLVDNASDTIKDYLHAYNLSHEQILISNI